jgi:hypothetical protein
VIAKAKEVFGPLNIKQMKFRSSSNAEDLPGFNGAGLMIHSLVNLVLCVTIIITITNSL